MLLFFGIFFYANMERKSFQNRVEKIEEKRSVDIAQIISFLPELRCTTGNVSKSLCVDKFKKDIFANVLSLNYNLYYQSVFSNTRIEIMEIFPNNSNYSTIYQGTESNESFATFIPISIFDPSIYPGSYGIGMMKITYYTFG
jgi:hypothetical protein